VQWRRPVGNLHASTIADIWARSRGLAEVRELTADVKTALSGERDAAFFNFCPGIAETTGGSPLAVYDGARQRATTIRQVIDERSPRGRGSLPVIQ
jgi:hypothetical protein